MESWRRSLFAWENGRCAMKKGLLKRIRDLARGAGFPSIIRQHEVLLSMLCRSERFRSWLRKWPTIRPDSRHGFNRATASLESTTLSFNHRRNFTRQFELS